MSQSSCCFVNRLGLQIHPAVEIAFLQYTQTRNHVYYITTRFIRINWSINIEKLIYKERIIHMDTILAYRLLCILFLSWTAISADGSYENIVVFIMCSQKKLISIVLAFNRCHPWKRALQIEKKPSLLMYPYCFVTYS